MRKMFPFDNVIKTIFLHDQLLMYTEELMTDETWLHMQVNIDVSHMEMSVKYWLHNRQYGLEKIR